MKTLVLIAIASLSLNSMAADKTLVQPNSEKVAYDSYSITGSDAKSVDILINYEKKEFNCHGNNIVHHVFKSETNPNRIIVERRYLPVPASMCPPSTKKTTAQTGVKMTIKADSNSGMYFQNILVSEGSVVEIVKH